MNVYAQQIFDSIQLIKQLLLLRKDDDIRLKNVRKCDRIKKIKGTLFMLDLVRNLDQFGATFSLQVEKDKLNHRSRVGGYLSFLVYAGCFGYAIYVFILWQGNSFLPIITSNTKPINQNVTIDIDFDFLSQELTYLQKDSKLYKYDVFTSMQKRIFQQLSISYVQTHWKYKPLIQSNPQCTATYNQSEAVCLDQSQKNNLTFFPLDFDQSSGVGMAFGYCANFKLPFCASLQESIDYISIQQTGIIQKIKLQNFNPETKELENFKHTFFFAIDPASVMTIIYQIQITELTITEGLLFPSSRKLQYISGVSATNQGFANSTFIQQSTKGALAITTLKVDPLKICKNIQYINLGQILAQVGSIFSLLLMLGEIARYINKLLLHNMLTFKILQIYFPELKTKQTQTNKLGKTIQIEGFTHEQSTQFMDTFGQLAISKFSYLDLIEEMAYLKWAIYTQLSSQNLEQIKFKGLKLQPVQKSELIPKPNQIGIDISSTMIERNNIAQYRTQFTRDRSPIRSERCLPGDNISSVKKIDYDVIDEVTDQTQTEEINRRDFLQFRFSDQYSSQAQVQNVNKQTFEIDFSRLKNN